MYLGLGDGKSRDEEGSGDERGDGEPPRLTDKETIVLDFHYYNYAFCKERRFDARATSTFLSILKDIFDEVRNTLSRKMKNGLRVAGVCQALACMHSEKNVFYHG